MHKGKSLSKNPIARAYAIKKLKDAVVSHRISIFMLDEGCDASSELTATALPVFAIMYCLEKQKKEDSIEYRKLKSAVNVLLSCAQGEFSWKKEYAITIDNALDIAQNEWGKIPPELLGRAIDHLSR